MQQSTNTIFKLLAKKSQSFNSYQQGPAFYCQGSQQQQLQQQQQQLSFNNINDLQRPIKLQENLSTNGHSLLNNNNHDNNEAQYLKQQKFNFMEEEFKTNIHTRTKLTIIQGEETKNVDESNTYYGNTCYNNQPQPSNINKRNIVKSNSEENEHPQFMEEINVKRKISLIINENSETSFLQSKILNNHMKRQRKISDMTDDLSVFEPQVCKKQQYNHFKPFITPLIRHRNSLDSSDQTEQMLIENDTCTQNNEQEQNNEDQQNGMQSKNGLKENISECRTSISQEKKFIPQSCPIQALDSPIENCYFTPLHKVQRIQSNEQKCGKSTGQMLDEDDFSLSNHSNQNLSTSEDDEIQINQDFELKRIIDNILFMNQASYHQTNKIIRLSSKVYINCYFKHKFVLTVQELKDNIWCSKCELMLTKIKSFARQNNGNCLNKVYLPNLVYQCQSNHVWETTHKVWNKRWCAQCDKQQKEDQKKLFKEREEQIYQQKMKLQEELFNQAKRNMQNAQNLLFQQKQQKQQQAISFQQKVINAFQKVEQDILKVAQEKSQVYVQQRMNQQQDSNVSIDQIIAVFKMILIPDNILRQYFQVLNQEVLKQEYRKMALSVHPDKNKHPKASVAFQKLNNIHSEIVERLNNIKNI